MAFRLSLRQNGLRMATVAPRHHLSGGRIAVILAAWGCYFGDNIRPPLGSLSTDELRRWIDEKPNPEPTRGQVVKLVTDILYARGTYAYQPGMDWPHEDASTEDTKAEVVWAAGVVRRLWPELDDASLKQFCENDGAVD